MQTYALYDSIIFIISQTDLSVVCSLYEFAYYISAEDRAKQLEHVDLTIEANA